MPFAEVSHRFLFMYFGGAQIRKRGSRGRVRGFLGWGNFREMRSTAGVWRTGMPSNAAQKCCDGARRFPRRIGILTRCVLCVSAGGGIVYFRRNQVVRSMPFLCFFPFCSRGLWCTHCFTRHKLVRPSAQKTSPSRQVGITRSAFTGTVERRVGILRQGGEFTPLLT